MTLKKQKNCWKKSRVVVQCQKIDKNINIITITIQFRIVSYIRKFIILFEIINKLMGCGSSIEDGLNSVIIQAEQTIHKRGKYTRIDCRRNSAFSNQIEENIEIDEDQNIKQDELEVIKSSLLKHFMFSNLATEQSLLQNLCEKFRRCKIKKGEYIFRQGDIGTCFFIIKTGKFTLQVNCQPVKILNPKDSFGELALVYSARRSSSIKALVDTELYFLKQIYFRDAIKILNDKNRERAKIILKSVKIFNYLTNKHKYSLISSCIHVRYNKGEIIFNQDDQASSLLIVYQGKVRIIIPNKEDVFIKPIQYFGEGALFGYKNRLGAAIAQEDTSCFSLSYKVMQDNLGNNINSVLFHNLEKWVLRRNILTGHLNEGALNEIQSKMSVEKASKYHILRKGNGDGILNIYIPLDCQINENKQKKIYGLGSLMKEFNMEGQKDDSYDIVVTEKGHYAYCPLDQLRKIIKRNKINVLSDLTNIEMQKTMKSIKSNQRTCKRLQTSNNIFDIKLQNFIQEEKLGEGQFGQVFLIRDKMFGLNFAIKRINKKQIIAEDLLQAVIREKELLEEVNSNFIEGYYQTQADKDYIYIILQFLKGVQLFDVLREIGLLPISICKYYLASIICALEYLHSKNIMYRDVKPENIMINEKGELILIDLGTAKKINPDEGFRTHTIIGTPHYMAPQMSTGKGYSLEIDYWALGVIAYEFICGRLPFGNDLEDPYDIFKQSRKRQLNFPKFIGANPAVSLIESLLQKDVKNRLVGGWIQLKQCSYFNNFDWQSLEDGKMETPYIPKKFKKPPHSKKHKEEIPFSYDKETLSLWDLTV